MEIEYTIPLLFEKNTDIAYKALQELEEFSDTSDELYEYTTQFAEMTKHEKYVIRVRGFRLFCKQAKWGVDKIIDEKLPETLGLLNDDKPTAVRQALVALQDVVLYKPALRGILKEEVSAIQYLRYNDTVQNLIYKDMQELLKLVNTLENT